MSDNAGQNTDRELWREAPGDYYANSIHVTTGGGIGINVGGMVHVKPLKDWHALAERAACDPEIVARHDHHPLDKLYADPQFQKEYHEELARERAAEPEPAVSEARVCLKCGRTEVGWRYNRCPNCGEMADEPEPAEGAPQSWEAVCRDVLAERVAQDQQWGGSTHDDNHRPDEWCLYIDKQRRLARDADDPRAYESRLIKIAALAVAAIQSSRRLNQPKAPGAAPAPAPGCPVTRNCHAGGNQSGEGARMSNTAEFKNPEPSPGDATHKWQPVHHRNYECCRVCGIIRRADRKNSACKGTTKMRPLESPTERA